MSSAAEVAVGRLDELSDPGCREFTIGEGDWPFMGFVVRQGDKVYAYQNFCVHVGHQLNWAPESFLSKDNSSILCSSHGAQYEIVPGCVSLVRAGVSRCGLSMLKCGMV